jgi:predicted XRE-type DNA-binding protein
MVSFDTQQYRLIFQKMGYSDDSGASLLLRVKLMKAIKSEIESRNLTQREAARLLGVTAPRICEIWGLRIDKFSTDLLVKYLHRLGKEVTVEIETRN